MGKGIRNIKISFEDPTLTHFGGMILFQRFCRKLDLKGILQRHIRWNRRSNLFHSSELILTIIYTMVAGMRRILDTRILHYNNCFQGLLGLKDFPTPSTLREFLKDLTPAELKGIVRIHDLLRQKMFVFQTTPTSLTFDLDSTILPVFGWKIQGARIGYNPKKRKRPSYWPLLCFEGRSRDSWAGILRPGDTGSATGAQILWQTVQGKIPKYLYRIRMRADAGFFDHKFIEPFDDKRIGYVVVAKISPPLKAKIQTLRYRTFRKEGWQAAQFSYQPWNWKKSHRFVVVRRPKPEKGEEELQLDLWEFKDYFYHLFVTNLSLSPQAVWYFYRKRARVELDIRELKESFSLGKIPTNSFLANEIHFQIILLAYDLVN